MRRPTRAPSSSSPAAREMPASPPRYPVRGSAISAPRSCVTSAAPAASSKRTAATLAYVGARLVAGMTTEEIDRLVRAHTAALGGRPSQLGYHGFPAAVCVSRNGSLAITWWVRIGK